MHGLLHGTVPNNMAAWCYYREDRLPEGMVRNGNVQKDSVLTFTRAGNGHVTAAANGTELTTGADALAVLSRTVNESVQLACIWWLIVHSPSKPLITTGTVCIRLDTHARLISAGFAVNSPAFAAAVFDLYVGDQPVSSEARTTALLAAQRMLASGACICHVVLALQPSVANRHALHGQAAVQRVILGDRWCAQ